VNFEDAVAWLYTTQLHGIRLGLDTVRRLIAALGIDTTGAKILHVAGTNGKGSVCAMLDAICRAAGKRTGLFTSPHLVTFRERICVDGVWISEEAVAQGLTELRALVGDWELEPTFFELTTVLALRHFQRSGCEVVVLETGMGGRLDATNVVTPAVSVITPISLDHQQWLGATIAEISAEKAGIFKPDVPAISSPQTDEAVTVLRQRAREIGALALDFVAHPWAGGAVNLAGSHQRWHAELAVRALALAALGIHEEAIDRGLREVQWPGRFQRVGERLVLDGAHNAAAAVRLVETWREEYGAESATLVLGVLVDKDLRTICAALLPIAARVIAVPVRSPRTVPPEDLRAVVRELSPEMPCEVAADFAAGLAAAQAHSERVMVSGSLFLVGEALALAGESLGRGASTEISAQ